MIKKKLKNNLKGQSTLEMALTLPLLLLLIFGMVFVGRYIHSFLQVTFAATEGVKQGTLTNDNTQIDGAVYAIMKTLDPNPKTSGNTTVIKKPALETSRKRGDELEVTVNFRFKLPFKMNLPAPYNASILSQGEIIISQKAVSRMEKE